MPYPISKAAKKEAPVEATKETKTLAAPFQFQTVRAERLGNDCYNVTAYTVEFDGTSMKLVEAKPIAEGKTRMVSLGAVRRFWTDTIGRSMDKGSGFE